MSSIRSVPPKLQSYRHVVYPFKDKQHAINAVSLFASSKLSKGESVVLIMPDSRCEPITARLAEAGFDICEVAALAARSTWRAAPLHFAESGGLSSRQGADVVLGRSLGRATMNVERVYQTTIAPAELARARRPLPRAGV